MTRSEKTSIRLSILPYTVCRRCRYLPSDALPSRLRRENAHRRPLQRFATANTPAKATSRARIRIGPVGEPFADTDLASTSLVERSLLAPIRPVSTRSISTEHDSMGGAKNELSKNETATFCPPNIDEKTTESPLEIHCLVQFAIRKG